VSSTSGRPLAGGCCGCRLPEACCKFPDSEVEFDCVGRPQHPHDFGSGPMGFMLATIGAAIGLGSIWKFPYEVGANGGGAFILFYLVGLALVVPPQILVEFAIGRLDGGTLRQQLNLLHGMSVPPGCGR